VSLGALCSPQAFEALAIPACQSILGQGDIVRLVQWHEAFRDHPHLPKMVLQNGQFFAEQIMFAFLQAGKRAVTPVINYDLCRRYEYWGEPPETKPEV
jgi:hypothetical protein